jgi:MoaA/NifB/PqqE/SkfB family radical SAM enzyme
MEDIVHDVVPAKSPRPAHLDRVHWNWDVWKGCNYACSYCVEYVPMRSIDLAKAPTAERWLEAWQRMHGLYGTGSMRVAGGEPVVYPGFLEFLNQLTKMFVMEVSTNLSVPWQRIAEVVDPLNLKLHTSFHPEYADQARFLEKLVNLRDRGFDLSVTCVTHPRTLYHLWESKKAFEENGFQFILQHFRGGFGGKEYPRDYTDEEKNLLKRLVTESFIPAKTDEEKRNLEVYRKANEATAEFAARPVEPANGSASAAPPQSAPSPAAAEPAPPPSLAKHTQGAVCGMGALYAKVEPDGSARRCCHKDSDPLGNIFDPDFRLLDEAKECYVSTCPCWRTMLVGINEDKWKPLWPNGQHRKRIPIQPAAGL